MQIGLLGSSGKFGKLMSQLLEQENTPFQHITRKILEDQSTFESFFTQSDPFSPNSFILLDLSLAPGTEILLKRLKALHFDLLKKIRALVIGTTGHNKMQMELMTQMAQHMPICLVSNFSKGIYLFEEILKAQTSHKMTVVELARKLGFDLALHELHHAQKKDAPSGTALTLAETAHISKNNISFLRVGEIVGEHTIYLSGASENLEIKHSAAHKILFAKGALQLCKNIYTKAPASGFLQKEDYF
jgi:4-hydroxy-tetrahydrodipicolinate reductase